MEWTLGSLIALAGTTGVISSLLTQFLTGGRELWMSSRQKKAHASYHALRLAVLLEAYTYACASFVQDNAHAMHLPDEEFPEWETKLPTLPPYPDDPEGWKAIDLKLAARALNLRNRIDGSQGVISATIEFTLEDLGETLDEHAAGRGLEALELARALRHKHGLDPVDLMWDFQETLESAHASAVQQQKKNREATGEMAEATADIPPPEVTRPKAGQP